MRRHQALQALLRERIGAGEIHRGAERHEAPVDREAVFRGQRNIERADRAVGRGQFPEKDIARVVVERVLQLSGIRRGPRLDALHGRLLERHLAAVDEIAAERAVRVAVLVGEAGADALAAVELDLAGALHLQEEQLHRVGGPCDHRRRQRAVAPVDFPARVIRHEAAAFHPAAQAQVAQLRIDRGEVHHDEIVRYAEDRVAIHVAARPAAFDDRLVIAGDQAAVPRLGRGQRIRAEIRLEEFACRALVAGGHARRSLAQLPEAPATGGKRAQARRHQGVVPSRQVGERHGFIARGFRRRLRRRALRARRGSARQLRAAGGQYNRGQNVGGDSRDGPRPGARRVHRLVDLAGKRRARRQGSVKHARH